MDRKPGKAAFVPDTFRLDGGAVVYTVLYASACLKVRCSSHGKVR